MGATSSLIRRESGTALVEFAFVLPILLFLVIGMLHFGKAFNYWINETHLANEGARFAVVNKNPGGTTDSLQQYIQKQAETAELRDGKTESVPKSLQVCIEFPQGQTIGAPVTVKVRSEYKWLPFLAEDLGPQVTLTGSATMRLEALPTTYSAGCVGGTA
jgi:Flp pilus assembly protein TadG